MLKRTIHQGGQLIIGCVSGIIKTQTLINSTFWQIDSGNIGELQEGYSQLYYDKNIQKINITEADVKKFASFNAGIAANLNRYRTALVMRHPQLIKLATMHAQLSLEYNYQVKVFNNINDGFDWIGHKNPNPDIIK